MMRDWCDKWICGLIVIVACVAFQLFLLILALTDWFLGLWED